jgi:hypothetical protein
MQKGKILLFFLLFLVVTGCKKEEKVTCMNEADSSALGYELTIQNVGTLEDEKVVKEELTMTLTFETEELATSSYTAIQEGMVDEDIQIIQKGNTITVTQTQEFDEGIDKSDFITSYEEDGYVCE